MRNRKYLIGALVGVIGALAFSGVASAAPTGQTLQTTLSPAKQDKKTFGGVSLHNIISTTIDNPATTQSPKTTVFTIDPNVKYVSGNIPVCPLSAIQGKFTAQAQAACPQSITGRAPFRSTTARSGQRHVLHRRSQHDLRADRHRSRRDDPDDHRDDLRAGV